MDNQEEENKTTHIRVSMKTRNFIDEKGIRNETFDDILKRLLKIK